MERENDIPKLMEFFKEMKAQNPYFYEEVQVDENNVIKKCILESCKPAGGIQGFW